MNTNLTELTTSYEELLKGDLFKDLFTDVILNNKKERSGSASITVNITHPEEEQTELSVTIYIVERNKTTLCLIVNNLTHDVVFNNTSPDSVEKSRVYITKYIERSTKRLLGIEIPDEEFDKKKAKPERTEKQARNKKPYKKEKGSKNK